ncbi:S-protein homolog 5-like [Malania oleifera]|uniref:S-protein homolog 5-like n=1 Tax=Malania oleifera TaxID=397392 RepID=UPI0025AE7E20|nr:S-protein homolog 5-like [Malania oleifera]
MSPFKSSLLALVLLALSMHGFPHVVRAKIHVNVTDSLGAASDPMTLHCQSKDNDLGPHNLSDGQFFSWHFELNFWGTTLFFCRVDWQDKFLYFNAYDYKNHPFQCDNNLCDWHVQPDGAYFLPAGIDHYVLEACRPSPRSNGFTQHISFVVPLRAS